jgi:hypothetical protein
LHWASHISRNVNFLFARIISLIFDTFLSAVEVDGRPEHCSSSVDSAPPPKRSKPLVYRLSTHSSIAINSGKLYMGLCSHFARFKTKFYVRSSFDLSVVQVFRQRCEIYEYIHCTVSNYKSRDSVLDIATGYGLDDKVVGVRVPVGARILISPCRPDRLWGPPSFLSNG